MSKNHQKPKKVVNVKDLRRSNRCRKLICVQLKGPGSALEDPLVIEDALESGPSKRLRRDFQFATSTKTTNNVSVNIFNWY